MSEKWTRPDGTGSRRSDQAPTGLAPAGFDPSRSVPPVIDRAAERRLMDEKIARLIPDPEEGARFFRGIRRVGSRRWLREPNWVVAMQVYGVGSTYAHGICQRLGINPDMKLGALR